ncbi:MAG: GtrA family protein [Okeania sp. SIO3B3]|nr:GtrA family protein [Okeania sp. SIO3B3]
MLSAKFCKFACVGCLGFVVDAAVVSLLVWIGLDPYSSRLGSYLAAVTTTWYFNRKFTFEGENPNWFREWVKFASANTVGGLANLTVYTVLVATVPFMQKWPFIAVGFGSVAGLLFNYNLSKKLVFKRSNNQEQACRH